MLHLLWADGTLTAPVYWEVQCFHLINSLERTPLQLICAHETRSSENELLRCKIKAGPLPGLVRHDRQLAAVRQQFWSPFDGCAL